MDAVKIVACLRAWVLNFANFVYCADSLQSSVSKFFIGGRDVARGWFSHLGMRASFSLGFRFLSLRVTTREVTPGSSYCADVCLLDSRVFWLLFLLIYVHLLTFWSSIGSLETACQERCLGVRKKIRGSLQDVSGLRKRLLKIIHRG